MKRNLLLLGVLLLSYCAFAQYSPHKSCGHEVMQKNQFESFEKYDQAKKDFKNDILPQLLKQGAAKSGTTIDVPVIFHVIHDGEPIGTGKNIADGQILAQLKVLNEDFSATNANFNDSTRASWVAVKDNPEINFCLTTEDPFGNEHSGIQRHHIAITGTDAVNNNIEDVKDSIYWNSNKFVNVYVLSIPGTDANGGVVGYAFLPYFGTVGQSLDGIVVDYNWFGGPGYSQSGDRTLTHEMGHFLGLFHTFDGDSCSSDDGLSDTPNSNTATSSLDGLLNCGDPMDQYPTGPTSCTEEHMYVNYMDYINDDNCPTSFTVEQVAVMRGVLLGTAGGYASRANLISNAAAVCGSCDLNASLNITDPSCDQISNGSITVIASGGTAPYNYMWSTNPTQDSATAVNLDAGTYTVTISDNNGCEIFLDTNIVAGPGVIISASSTDETIPGANDGTAEIMVSSGTAPFSYNWDPVLSPTSTQSGLSPGLYIVTVSDNVGCHAIDSIYINPASCPDLNISYSSTDVACEGGTDGQAVITVSNGVAPYTYRWNNESHSAERIDLSAGVYTVVVTDDVGCMGDITFTISEPHALIASITTSDLTSVGANDGMATVSASGGTSGYDYVWSTGDTSRSIQNLAPGSYSVTVSDSNNCMAVTSGEVKDFDCTSLNVDINGMQFSCSGDTITLSASANGKAPFSYVWSNGGNTADISTANSGIYEVSVTDSNGCVGEASFMLNNHPEELNISFIAFSESGVDQNDGRIELTVSGGVPTYAYSWSNGMTTSTVDNLIPGDYFFTVTDDNGCFKTGQSTVNAFQCSTLDVNLTAFDASCSYANDGSAVVSSSTGRAPFTFTWNTGDSTQAIQNLPSDNYTVTVTDANACLGVAEIFVSSLPEIVFDFQVTHVSAIGASDGSIDASVSGGTPPYYYQWSNGSQSSSLDSLSVGSYNLSVTDANNCTSSATIIIEQYVCPELQVEFEVKEITCNGLSNGEIRAFLSNGTAPFSFAWSNGLTEDKITHLSPGNYLVEVQDSKGCQAVDSITLDNPETLELTVDVDHESTNNGNDGNVSLNIQGGVQPYQVFWSDSISGIIRNQLAPGKYDFFVSDNNGCNIPGTVIIAAYECPNLGLELEVEDNLCEDGDEGGIEIFLNNGTLPFTYILNGEIQGSNPSIRGLDQGSYELEVIDSKDCADIATFEIETPEGMQVSDLSTLNARGNEPGSAAIEVYGGFEPYTYLWSDGRTLSENANLYPGIHAVSVTDAAGCQLVQEVTIYQEEEIGEISELELFQAHPNPAYDRVNIQVEFESIRSIKVVITAIAGNPVYIETVDAEIYNENIDISQFPKGHYKIAIYTDNEVIAKSLVIM